MSGRPSDAIWLHFNRRNDLGPNKAECRNCKHVITGNAQRMRAHWQRHENEYPDVEQIPGPSSRKQPRISGYAVSTTKEQMQKFDDMVGEFFFANNIPFSAVESKQFVRLCENLRPGYKPPTRRGIGSEVLDRCHSRIVSDCSSVLHGKEVPMCLDGWTNASHDSIIASSIQNAGNVYIVETTDASGYSHTTENLTQLAEKHIEKAESVFGVKVSAIITDNAGNMNAMRNALREKHGLMEYGCGAHQLNLVAKDLVPNSVVSKVTEVAKFFRNCHLPQSWLQELGANRAPMPSLVRWNSVEKLLSWYIEEWQKLKDALKCLKPVSVALNKMQSDSIEIATGFEVWKDLLSTFREMGSEGREWLEVVERRYENSVPPLWCLANVLHPNFVGKKLTTKEWKSAKDCFVKMYPDDVPEFIHFIGSFKDQYNNEYEQSGCPVVADFIKSQVLTGELSVKLGNVSEKILNLPPSSAGIERVFSSLGYVHSDVRNRLGQEKAAKLAFVLRALKKEHYF